MMLHLDCIQASGDGETIAEIGVGFRAGEEDREVANAAQAAFPSIRVDTYS